MKNTANILAILQMSEEKVNIHCMKYQAGSHVPFTGTITSSIMFGIQNGMNTIQFFMGNPKKYNRTIISEEDLETSKKILKKFPINVFTHFPYSANFAGSVKDGLAWNNNPQIDYSMGIKIKGVEYELKTLSSLGMKNTGVIIHPGSFPNREEGHKTVSKSINKINFPKDGSKLLLENCAGEGTKLCKTFTEIKKVLDLVDDDKKDSVGVCVDTAHIWGAGTYDLSKIEGVKKMFEDFESIIGIEKFKLLHLNDSKASFGSKKDLHQLIGQGQIWGKNIEPLRFLLHKCEENNIPILLETTPSDVYVIAKI